MFQKTSLLVRRAEIICCRHGRTMKKEVAEAKKRKKSASGLDKSEREVLNQRKELYKQLAPHFIGEVGIPVAWLLPPPVGFANRDYYEEHMWTIQSAMESSGVSYPWKPAVVCAFNVKIA